MIKVLTGTNSFLLRRHLDALVASFVAEQGDLALERLDGEIVTVEQLKDAVQSLPFLASKKLVVVQGLASNKAVIEHIEKLLQTVNDTTDLILVDAKLDKRSSYYKLLKKQQNFHEFTETDSRDLAPWAMAYAQEQAGHISRSDAAFLIERIGTNQMMLASELDKLLTANTKITKDLILQLVEPTPQSTVFELLDAAFSSNKQRALSLYDEQRKLKVEPQAIIGMLAWQLHILALIKTARGMDVAREAKVNPYVVRKSQNIANKMTLKELQTLIERVLQVDILTKSEPIDPDDALRNLLISMH